MGGKRHKKLLAFDKEVCKLATMYLIGRWGYMYGNRVTGITLDLPGCMLGMEDSKRELELVIKEYKL